MKEVQITMESESKPSKHVFFNVDNVNLDVSDEGELMIGVNCSPMIAYVLQSGHVEFRTKDQPDLHIFNISFSRQGYYNILIDRDEYEMFTAELTTQETIEKLFNWLAF